MKRSTPQTAVLAALARSGLGEGNVVVCASAYEAAECIRSLGSRAADAHVIVVAPRPDDNGPCLAGDIALDLARQTVVYQGREHRLTPTECRILAMLLERPDRIVSTHEILEAVWAERPSANRRIVAVYMSGLRKVLEPTPFAPRRLVCVRGRGYMLSSAPKGAASGALGPYRSERTRASA